MPTYNASFNNNKVTVDAKLLQNECLNEQELNTVSEKQIKGLLKLKKTTTFGNHHIIYSGPQGISLGNRLNKPVSKFEFFLMVEQIIDLIKELGKENIDANKILWDVDKTYINEMTQELNFCYLPLTGEIKTGNTMEFLENMVYGLKRFDNINYDYVPRFLFFLRKLKEFDAERIEQYLLKEEPELAEMFQISEDNASLSEPASEPDEEPKEIFEENLYVEEDEITNELLDEKTVSPFVFSDSSLFKSDHELKFGFDSSDNEDSKVDNTIIFTDRTMLEKGDVLLFEDEGTVLLEDERTTLLENNRIGFSVPSLLRVSTNERISISKPVFRIGKKRETSDYCVSNNNAVSHNHAEIICKNTEYFIKDLNSTNKTYINGDLIPSMVEMQLSDGDNIILGNEEFTFYIE